METINYVVLETTFNPAGIAQKRYVTRFDNFDQAVLFARDNPNELYTIETIIGTIGFPS